MVTIFQTLVNVTTPAEKLQEEMLQQTSTFPRPMDKLKKYEDVKVIVENLIILSEEISNNMYCINALSMITFPIYNY